MARRDRRQRQAVERRTRKVAVGVLRDFEHQMLLGSNKAVIGRHAEAAEAYRRAIALVPDVIEAHVSLGNALNALERLDEAEAAYRDALAIDPRHKTARWNLGGSLLKQGRIDEAVVALEAVLEDHPDDDVIAGNLAIALLRQGRRLDEAWVLHEAGLPSGQRGKLNRFPCPRWRGEELRGKRILVWREQGVGDELRYASCYGDVLARGGDCVIAAQPRLVALTARSFPEARVISVEGYDPMADRLDFQIPAGSLPSLLRTRIEDFPAREGYLIPDPARVAHWRSWLAGLGGGPTLGICWRSRLATSENVQHFTDLVNWAPVLAMPGLRLVSLQYDDDGKERAALAERLGVEVIVPPGIDLRDDLDDLAALIRALDLVLTVGTSVGDLAGAVGAECWTVLNAWIPDLLGTDHLPWYPRTRVFQKAWNEPWTAVFERIAGALAERAAAASGPAAPPPSTVAAPESRNAPCPCGSGKRYKHCCGRETAPAAPPPGPERPNLPKELRVFRPHFLAFRIGEMALQLGAFAMMREMGMVEAFTGVVVAPPGKAANATLLDYFHRWIVVSERGDPAQLPSYDGVEIAFPDGRVLHEDRANVALYRIWEEQGRGSLLALHPDHARDGRRMLANLGVPEGDWFVTLHVRDHDFLADPHNDYRNADIATYLPAVAEIAARGGHVVRIGHPDQKPLPGMPGLVDYALSPARADWMDVFLMGGARFFLGTTSGPWIVADLFGVPVALANNTPFSERPFSGRDLYIPKLYLRDGAPVPFAEAMRPPYRHRFTDPPPVRDNSADEIVELVREMLERLDGKAVYTADDEALQGRITALSEEFEPFGVASRMGRDFLRRHRHLA